MKTAGRTPLKERIERRHGRPFEEVLRHYAAQHPTPERLADQLGCCVKSLIEHGRDYGLEIVRTCHMRDPL